MVVANGNTTVANQFAIWLGKTCTVTVAHDRKTAYSLLDKTIDVVVFERNMSDTAHLDVIAALYHKNLDCQVVMITDEEPSTDIIEAEVDASLSKPTSEEEVCDTVEQLAAFARYGEGIEDLFTLTVIKALLETNTGGRFTRNDQYGRVKTRVDELQDELAEMTETFSQTQFTAEMDRLASETNSESESY